MLCVKKEAKEGRNVGKNKGIPTHELGLETDGLLYVKYLRKSLVVSLKNIVIFFRKEEREGEERKSEEEVRRDRRKERRGEGRRKGVCINNIASQKSLTWTEGTIAIW